MTNLEVSDIALLGADFCSRVEGELVGEEIVGTVVMVCDIADEDGKTRLCIVSSDMRDWVVAGLLDRAAQDRAVEVVEDEPEEEDDP